MDSCLWNSIKVVYGFHQAILAKVQDHILCVLFFEEQASWWCKNVHSIHCGVYSFPTKARRCLCHLSLVKCEEGIHHFQWHFILLKCWTIYGGEVPHICKLKMEFYFKLLNLFCKARKNIIGIHCGAKYMLVAKIRHVLY